MSDSTPSKSGDRRRSLRELITLARERFGPDAARLKTREELEAALGAPSGGPSPVVVPPPPSAPRLASPPEVVVRDFFLRKA